jgi:hypothetical protein
MKNYQTFRLIVSLLFTALLANACRAATPAPTAAPPTAAALSATATPPPPTPTSVPATDTPTSVPSDTPIPATNTATTAPTDTIAPPSATPLSPTATNVPPTIALRLVPTNAVLPPLIWTIQTSAPTVLLDIMQKTLNRKGEEVSVSNGYADSLTFGFPGNEPVNGLVGKTVGNNTNYSVVGQPFTIPGSGGFMDTILSPGDYAWSAQISGTGQAQGSFSIQKGQQVLLTFGK